MEHESFYINNRFFTDPATNIVKEIKGANETRLEPRLMLLLCILSKNEGKVVSREFLVKEIWNDYGGADEGLTQAISFLRKVIGDHNKEIIETVPKKGYVLHATISKNINEEEIKIEKTKLTFHKYIIAAFVLAVLISGYFILKRQFSKKTNSLSLQVTSPADSNENKDKSVSLPSQPKTTEVVFPGLKETDEINYLNTITTTDSSGNRYRLIMIGDRRPKFFVNDTLQPNMEPYTALIDKLAKELWRRQKEAEKK